MILWTIKLLTTIRRAIAGRKYPHQLAWAVAFGLLLGVVPHGNLLALVLLVIVVSLKLNHAMAALTAIGASFMATKLDPYSHRIGEYILSHPQVHDTAVKAWSLPLVPWTNLNNTVVLGSLIIGTVALIPVFVVTYPVFRFLSPREDSEPIGTESTKPVTKGILKPDSHQVVFVDQGHASVRPPHPRRSTANVSEQKSTGADERIQFVEIPANFSSIEANSSEQATIETRIDVIRMKESVSESSDLETENPDETDPQPMDEALNYLLRQLRDSQTRKAA